MTVSLAQLFECCLIFSCDVFTNIVNNSVQLKDKKIVWGKNLLKICKTVRNEKPSLRL